VLRFLQNHGQRQRSSTENPALGGNNRIFSSITPPNLHEDTVAETVPLEFTRIVSVAVPGEHSEPHTVDLEQVRQQPAPVADPVAYPVEVSQAVLEVDAVTLVQPAQDQEPQAGGRLISFCRRIKNRVKKFKPDQKLYLVAATSLVTMCIGASMATPAGHIILAVGATILLGLLATCCICLAIKLCMLIRELYK